MLYGASCESLWYRYLSDPAECIVKTRAFEVTIYDCTIDSYLICNSPMVLLGVNSTQSLQKNTCIQFRNTILPIVFHNDYPRIFLIKYHGSSEQQHIAYSLCLQDAISLCIQYNNNRYYIEQHNAMNRTKIPDSAKFFVVVEPLGWYNELKPITSPPKVSLQSQTKRNIAVSNNNDTTQVVKRKRGRPKGSKNKPKLA